MASVDWQKATTQKAGAMKKHNGKNERVNIAHSNADIDKSKSHLNVYIGADDYAPMLDKVKARIKEVDEKYPPKRNMGDKRITCIMLETPVPQEITEQGKAEDFLRNAHKVIEDFFGAENVGGTCGHFDEQHWYTDKDGKERMSLVHGHTLVAAYAEWQDKKTGELRRGINGKNCETKTRLRALNKAMDDMCLREYGISYNTAETPERKSVERLKEETELRREADMQRKELDELAKKRVKLKEIDDIEVKKSLFGSNVTVSKENWDTVTGLAQKGITAAKRVKTYKKERDAAVQERDELKAKLSATSSELAQYKQKEKERGLMTRDKLHGESEKVKLRQENTELRRKLSVCEEIIDKNGLSRELKSKISADKTIHKKFTGR